MKRVGKGSEPQSLFLFRSSNPSSQWEQCKRNTTRHHEIQRRICQDQSGLCAYCEIDLRPRRRGSLADFRIEHFHPKSDMSTDVNWHLEWSNLLGCCHGGSQAGVPDRYTTDHSCDVPKGDKNLDGIILNPLRLPSDCLFSFSRSNGSITVKEAACQKAGIEGVALNTIQELQLDGVRLRRLRKATLDGINQKATQLLTKGLPIDEVHTRLAKALLTKDASGCWPAFFSAIRSYLGSAAEKHLTAMEYNE